MSETRQWIFKAPPERLAELLSRDPRATTVWRPEELAAVLRHQLASVIRVDMAGLTGLQARQLRVLADAEGLMLKSYSDLFRHSLPPLDLLVIVKEYAKAASVTSDGPLPPEVARVLYFTCLAAAWVRHRACISSLTAAELRAGFDWVLDRPWADPIIKDLCTQAIAAGMPSADTASPQP